MKDSPHHNKEARMMNWHGKRKALTFSYDDGVWQDERLAELFNRYQVKCTFNVNSALLGDEKGRCMSLEKARKVYRGHEVAAHTLTHPHLEKLSRDDVLAEVLGDKKALTAMFGAPVCGMAYPFGTYSDEVVDVLRTCGIAYSRTVEASLNLEIPQDLLRLKPTCHHDHPQAFERAEAFLRDAGDKPLLLYIWGHSYEFDQKDNWQRMEDLLKLLSGHDDVFYGTNSEALL